MSAVVIRWTMTFFPLWYRTHCPLKHHMCQPHPAQRIHQDPSPPQLFNLDSHSVPSTQLSPFEAQVQDPLGSLAVPTLPHPRPSKAGWAGGQADAMWAGFTACPARLLVQGGRRGESVPLYGQLSLIVIVCSLGAQQTSRGDTPSMHAARSPATRPIRTVN